MNTKTIKPAGGGDYTTLQSWETAMDVLGVDDFVANCYSGGNLGDLVMSSWDAASTVVIQAATGEGHGGSLSAGAYVDSSAAIALDINTEPGNVQIRGLRILGRASASTTNAIDFTFSGTAQVQTHVVDSCLIQCRAALGITGTRKGIAYNRNDATQGGDGSSITVTNNIIIMAVDSTPAHEAIRLTMFTIGGNIVGSITACNNTIVRTGAGTAGKGLYVVCGYSGGDSADIDRTVYNNLICDVSTGCLVDSVTGVNAGTTLSGDNATSDSTSGAFGGSGNISSIVKADEFTNPASDWSLLETAQTYEAGFNLSGSFINDAFGNTRVLPWNIGAWGGTYAEPEVPVVPTTHVLLPSLFLM